MSDDPLKTAKDGMVLVGEVIRAAGNDPHVKEAAGNLGQSAVTLTKAINNVLLPIAAVNFAFDKARQYFAGQFQKDIADKTSDIPAESIVEPKASIAGPTMQGLAFTHDEANLKDMYLSLIATAMDGRVASSAHPAFVEMIKQLDAEEAALIRGVLRSTEAIPIVQLRAVDKSQGFRVLATHVLNLREDADQVPVENSRLAAMVDNWIRLGLVDVDYDKRLSGIDAYAWVESRPEFARLRQLHEDVTWKVTFRMGFIERTQLGQQFAAAVGLL